MNDEWYHTPQYPLGQRIAEFREKHHIKLRQLARLSGLSPGFLSDIEHQKKNPTLSTMQKLCKGFGLSLFQFFSDESSADIPTDSLVERICHLDRKQQALVNDYLNSILDSPD